MEDWTYIKSALAVARMGTLSAASEVLGVHHTTILRQIAALENQLRTKLFIRHGRGYSPTESGKILTQAASLIEEQLNQAAEHISAQDASNAGFLVITTIPEFAPVLTDIMALYQHTAPNMSVLIKSDEKLLALDQGEAQIGIRSGPKPTEQDYIAQLLETTECTLCAHRDYVAEHGMMESITDIGNHKFLVAESSLFTSPEMEWVQSSVPNSQIVLKTNSYASFERGVCSGLGIGPMPIRCVKEQSTLVPALSVAPPDEWATDVWAVTHVDVHWSVPVQQFLSFLKEKFSENHDQLI